MFSPATKVRSIPNIMPVLGLSICRLKFLSITVLAFFNIFIFKIKKSVLLVSRGSSRKIRNDSIIKLSLLFNVLSIPLLSMIVPPLIPLFCNAAKRSSNFSTLCKTKKKCLHGIPPYVHPIIYYKPYYCSLH